MLSACMCVCTTKSLKLRLTLCDPMNCSPPGSSVHGILRQEYWSGLLYPPSGDLPTPGMEPMFLKSPVLTGRLFTTSTTWEVYYCLHLHTCLE